MSDESPESDSEIRRRAAWLLGMLALVAALFVALMVTFFNTSGGDDNTDNLAGPTEVGVPSTSASPSPTPSARSGGSSSGPTSGASSGTTAATSGTAAPPTGGTASCPASDPCALDTDIGNAVAAINAYRTENGKKAVPATVSAEAKKCALSNGSDCSGGWAETQVPAQDGKADGKAAVQKIQEFGKLLSDMKSIAVGWAYDPGAEQFYFAIVRSE